MAILNDYQNNKLPTDNNKSNKLLEKLLKKFVLNAVIEFWNISLTNHLSNKTSYLGFNHFKITLDQSVDKMGFKNESYWPHLLFHDRYWCVELLVESFWFTYHSLTPSEYQKVMKKRHYTSTPIFVGIILIRFGSLSVLDNDNTDQTILKLDIMLDCLQIEIDQDAVTIIISIVR